MCERLGEKSLRHRFLASMLAHNLYVNDRLDVDEVSSSICYRDLWCIRNLYCGHHDSIDRHILLIDRCEFYFPYFPIERMESTLTVRRKLKLHSKIITSINRTDAHVFEEEMSKWAQRTQLTLTVSTYFIFHMVCVRVKQNVCLSVPVYVNLPENWVCATLSHEIRQVQIHTICMMSLWNRHFQSLLFFFFVRATKSPFGYTLCACFLLINMCMCFSSSNNERSSCQNVMLIVMK